MATNKPINMFTATTRLTQTAFRNNMLRSQLSFGNMLMAQPATRIFSSNVDILDKAPGFADVSDVLKVNHTEEFDQGLTVD